MSFKIHYCTLL